ncbi:MAG: spore coat protein GerQ [Bacillales bacterium]|nr:spore coat protein GerQ [Bacillales bacterium]
MRQQTSGTQPMYYTYPQGYPAQMVQPSPYPHMPFYPGANQQQQMGGTTSSQQTSISQNIPGMLPLEQSYIENILRLNKGKVVTVYMTFENNREWNAKIFKGIIEAAGRDHLIISDPQTGTRYLLPIVYVDYITFEEPIEYEYPFASGGGPGTFQP